MPSHTQAGRVADGSVDLAICWVRATDLAEQELTGRLIGADRLSAIAAGPTSRRTREGHCGAGRRRHRDLGVVESIRREFAAATGAEIVRIDDHGITGPAFFEHVRGLRRPVVNSPKGQDDPLPRDLVRRPVVNPSPIWTWSLVWRRSEDNAVVHALIDEFTRGVGDFGLRDASVWLPADDPHQARDEGRG